MASHNFLKKIIIFSLLFFLGGGQIVFAQAPPPVEEEITISARVGEDIESTSSGQVSFPTTAVRFSGLAYPYAKVTLLKNGQEQAVVLADSAGVFSVTFGEDYNSSILYSLIAEDLYGNRSLIINYPIFVQVGFLTHLSGIRFAPTIVTDKAEARYGEYLTVSGYALPTHSMEIVIRGSVEKIFSLTSSLEGPYKIVLPLSGLPRGSYTVSARYSADDRVSKLIKFIIGEANIYHPDTLLNIPGDCNADKIINLVDFSILAFWYGKSNPPRCVDTNEDGKINLVDFSILAFYWTG